MDEKTIATGGQCASQYREGHEGPHKDANGNWPADPAATLSNPILRKTIESGFDEATATGAAPVRPEYQERVIKEKAELDDKIPKLRFFLDSPAFQKLSQFHQVYLTDQYVAMNLYSFILSQRITAF